MPKKKLKTVERVEDIPAFETEREEQAFWQSHELGAGLTEGARHDEATRALMAALPTRAPRDSRLTSIRLDGDLERRLKHVARLKGVPYQTLLKTFVQERLYEEEKRLDVI